MNHEERTPISIERLTPKWKSSWEQLVTGSPNGHLMARYGFFLYHADRFDDHSLLFCRGSRVFAVLPANRAGDTLWSHQGVSFGGLIMARRSRFEDIREIFAALREYLRANGFAKLLYRPAPHPYHRPPREDDLYCLLDAGARIVDTKMHAMLICGRNKAATTKWRQNVGRAAAAGIRIVQSDRIAEFWPHVERLLRDRHDQKPVHSLDDIVLLASRFPGEIRLLEAQAPDGTFLGGLLYLVSNHTLNFLYSGETAEGRELGAGRLTTDHLIHAPEHDGYWLDLGQWTDTDTREESASLLYFKESAGARLIQRHTWELECE